MTDLAVLAIGLGVIPLAAILLYSLRGFVLAHREGIWGFLVGVLAFLALGHAMAAVLVNKSLFGDTSIATAVAFVGLAVGAGIAWLVLEGPFIQKEPNRILWVAVAFLGLHSLGDGLVLGRDFVGGVVPSVQVDGLTVGATVAHRFVEGCLVVVPAIWGAWKARPAFALLLVSLASVLAAYIPGAVFTAYGGSLRSLVQVAVPTFFAAIEASLGFLLLVRGFLPIAAADRGNRWPWWTAVGVIAISLVHFLDERAPGQNLDFHRRRWPQRDRGNDDRRGKRRGPEREVDRHDDPIVLRGNR